MLVLENEWTNVVARLGVVLRMRTVAVWKLDKKKMTTIRIYIALKEEV